MVAQKKATATKDPVAKLDFGFDWSAWLGTDTILTSTWTADPGLILSGPTFDGTKTSVWIEGGVAGDKLSATNHITTVAGRIDERTIVISIKEQ